MALGPLTTHWQQGCQWHPIMDVYGVLTLAVGVAGPRGHRPEVSGRVFAFADHKPCRVGQAAGLPRPGCMNRCRCGAVVAAGLQPAGCWCQPLTFPSPTTHLPGGAGRRSAKTRLHEPMPLPLWCRRSRRFSACAVLLLGFDVAGANHTPAGWGRPPGSQRRTSTTQADNGRRLKTSYNNHGNGRHPTPCRSPRFPFTEGVQGQVP